MNAASLAIAAPDDTPGRTAAVRRVAAHIEQNFMERLTLQDLAALAGLSVFRLVTVFRREVGMPPHRYLCHVRIRAARALLGRGVPPAIVASEAGFFDQSHLSRHFKSICGVTPGQYLARCRSEAALDASALADHAPAPQHAAA
ncbi:MAG: helix-turn-helix transcriptional regulator [Alphaproteobacteria bacterium]|nr:helix-turn-helix transcriptional regulator [Alphaproteobacteria bacterium]